VLQQVVSSRGECPQIHVRRFQGHRSYAPRSRNGTLPVQAFQLPADIPVVQTFPPTFPDLTMSERLKSWLRATGLSAVLALAVWWLNLKLPSLVAPQPAWMTGVHVTAAFIGTLAITRFVQGAPDALRGPTAKTVVAQGVVARVGVINVVVPGKSAFFSTGRCLMILCFVLCLMAQFVEVGTRADAAPNGPAGEPAVAHRLTT
jgi:hypothetical protein